MEIKRFRIIDSDRNVIEKYHTLDDVNQFLFRIDAKGRSLNLYQIECVHDDIIVSAKEVYNAFCEGECPGDLQFF